MISMQAGDLVALKIGGVYASIAAVELADVIDLQSIPGLGILGVSLLYAFRIAIKANDTALKRSEDQVEKLTEENERLWDRLRSVTDEKDGNK